MIDLSKFDLSPEGEEMVVTHPATGAQLIDESTGEPVTITLVGRDSDEFRTAQRKNIDKRAAMQKRMMSFEEIEAEATDTLVACTKGWKHVGLDGEDLPFSAENARKLYTRYYWLREQVDVFVARRANFFRP